MTSELDDFVEKQEEEYKREDLKKTITRLHKQIDKMRNRYDDLELAVKNALRCNSRY